MIDKKGISPLIAVTLILTFVVVVSGIVSLFFTRVVRVSTEIVETPTEKVRSCAGATLSIKEVECTRKEDLALLLHLDSVNASSYTLDSSLYGNHGYFNTSGEAISGKIVSGRFGKNSSFLTKS
jgi:FlaG/FlaF family flagellin (archaellin)